LSSPNSSFTTGNTANFSITKASLPVSAVPFPYTTLFRSPAFTWTYSGFQGTDTAGNSNITGAANCTRVSGETVASSPYAITCARSDEHSSEHNSPSDNTCHLTITKNSLSVNAVAASKTYG